MSVEGAALLILIALAAGVVVGQRVRLGTPRCAPAGQRPAGPRVNDTYAIPVTKAIAAGCGCS